MGKNKRLSLGLLKVGELAKKAGINPSTVRYYTNIGLLPVATETRSGYKLYDSATALSRISIIKQMNGTKPSLSDIKSKLNH